MLCVLCMAIHSIHRAPRGFGSEQRPGRAGTVRGMKVKGMGRKAARLIPLTFIPLTPTPPRERLEHSPSFGCGSTALCSLAAISTAGFGMTRSTDLSSQASGSIEWELLLQSDSDNNAEFMWPDAGRRYFWLLAQISRPTNSVESGVCCNHTKGRLCRPIPCCIYNINLACVTGGLPRYFRV